MTTFAQAVSLLRADSRIWWWHVQQRKEGKNAAARRDEIRSVRNEIEYLREGRLAGIALNGTWIHGRGKWGTWSVSGASERTLQVIRVWAPHIPIVDKRSIPEELLNRYVFRSPMDSDQNEDSNSSMSYVTTPVYCAIWKALGATVHWGKYIREDYINLPIVQAHVSRIKA